MDKYIVNGGNALFGSVNVQAAKNSVLPILAASVLTDEKIVIRNVPSITDVHNMVKILGCLGCRCTFVGNDVIIDASYADCYKIDRKSVV